MRFSAKRWAYSDMPSVLSQSAICCIAAFPASCGAFNSHIDFAAEHPEVDWFGQQYLSAAFQSLTLRLGVAIGGNHNDWNVRPQGLRFGQEFKPAHPRHINVGQDEN